MIVNPAVDWQCTSDEKQENEIKLEIAANRVDFTRSFTLVWASASFCMLPKAYFHWE